MNIIGVPGGIHQKGPETKFEEALSENFSKMRKNFKAQSEV